MRARHHAQAAVLGSGGRQSQPDRRDERLVHTFRDAILMPADERRALSELIKQARGLQEDVWANELFHAVEDARMSAQLPRPTEIEMRPIEARDAAAKRVARLLDLTAKMAHFVTRKNRDRV